MCKYVLVGAYCMEPEEKCETSEEQYLGKSAHGTDGCESLRQWVKYSKNERIKSLIRSGVDLIAKEAEYHKTCRSQFLKETGDEDKPTEGSSSQSYHKRAFAPLLSYIQTEVVEKQ